MNGIVFDLRKYSINDGPGIRTTVFLKGCPLECWWCHNPEGRSRQTELLLRPARCIQCRACVEACDQGAVTLVDGLPVTDRQLCDLCGDCVASCYAEGRQLTGRPISVAQVLAEIERDRAFYDESGGGVTFSGGEPLLQRPFLVELLSACRQVGLHTTVDTCGYAAWAAFESILPFVNLYLYDIKMIDSQLHRRYTGVDNALILNNLRRLSELACPIIVRFPVIPGINDDNMNLHQTGAFLSSLPNLIHLELLPYHDSARAKYEALSLPYPLPDARTPGQERMEELAAVLGHYITTVIHS